MEKSTFLSNQQCIFQSSAVSLSNYQWRHFCDGYNITIYVKPIGFCVCRRFQIPPSLKLLLHGMGTAKSLYK